MSEQLQSPSKRALFKTAAAVGATLATGSLIACQQQPAASPSNSPASGASNPTSANNDACGGSGHSNVSIPCHGAHQAGIITPDKEQPFGTLCAFDVLAKNTKELENFFRTLTARIEFLTQGGEIAEIDDKLPPPSSGILGKQIPPDGLTITVGVGNSLFDARFGLAKHKPLRLQEMKDFPNDKLVADWCDGDISLQISAFSPETCQNALRDIIKNTSHVATIRWAIDGWAPKTEAHDAAARNLFGFRDGTGNPNIRDPKVADTMLWTGITENSQDEPAWAKNGTYQAIRIIRQLVEFWDRTPLQEQQDIFGRAKYSAAPLGKKHEHDAPDYASDPDGKRIPKDSHMRLATPHDPEFLKKHHLSRRPYNYSLGLSTANQLDVGLILTMYQANLADGFIFVQGLLNGEPLEEYIKPFGGGYFFVLPGFEQGGYLGDGLIKLVQPQQ